MNIIFMGTPDFAVPSLRRLIDTHHNISAVVTTPDKPKGRGLRLSSSAVKQFAEKENLKILQPEKLRDFSFVNEIKILQPDLIVVVAFRILPKEVYTIPKFGSFNLHASLLPKYRGAAPINWAIINGDSETGVTTFFLQDKVDTGNIIIQQVCSIEENDNAGTIHDKLAQIGADAVLSTVNLIEMTNGNVPVESQEEAGASPAPKIFKDDCRTNWNKTAEQIHDFIRGLSPYPAAFTTLNGKIVKIYWTQKLTSFENNLIPGEIKIESSKIFVSCSDSRIEILELQPEGKKRMPAKDFVNGHLVKNGDKFI
jgi:methionyl-tRNA formyltransferase